MLWYFIQILNISEPHGISTPIFPLLLSSYVCPVILCFEWRSYVCMILGLYYVLMYVSRVRQFVLPRFCCLYGLPMYVDPPVFFVLRSHVFKILYVLMYLDYWFLFPTIFMLVMNSHVRGILRFFACTEFLRKRVKHFIPIKNKMIRCPKNVGRLISEYVDRKKKDTFFITR